MVCIMIEHKFTLKSIVKNIDLLLCYFMVLAGAAYFAYQALGSNFNPIMPLILIAFPLTYAKLRGSIQDKHFHFDLLPAFIYLNELIFIISFIADILLLFKNVYSSNFFLVSTVMASSILISIFSQNKKKDSFILIKIVVLITIIRSSIFYSFPEIYGIDPLFHARFSEQILSSFYIPKEGDFLGYSFYPIYQIILAQLNIISSLSIRNSMFIIGILQISVTTGIIYLIGLKFAGREAGLLASFIFSGTANVITTGFSMIPNMFGLIPFALALYTIIGMKYTLSRQILLILCLFSLIFVHPYPPLILLIILGIIYLIGLIIHNDNLAEKVFEVKFNTLFLLLIIYLGNMVSSGNNPYFKTSVLNTFAQLDQDYIVTKDVYDVPFKVLIYNNLYYLFIIGFCLFGLLSWMNIGKRDRKQMNLSVITLMLLIIYFSIQLFNVSFLPIPYRILPFFLLLISVFVSVGLLSFTSALKIRKKSMSIICIIILCLSFFFFSMTSYLVSPDDGLFSDEQGYRQTLSSAELSSLNYLLAFSNESFETDSYYKLYVGYKGNTELFQNLNDLNDKKVILLRSYFLDKPYLRHLSKYNITSENKISRSYYENSLHINSWNMIYSNDKSWVYRK